MEHLLWFFKTTSIVHVLIPIAQALVICIIYYQLDTYFLIGRYLLNKVTGKDEFPGLAPENHLHILVVLPTMMRKRGELDGLKRAIDSVAHNGYPGRLTIVGAIDDRSEAPELYRELQKWVRDYASPAGVDVHVCATPRRMGKAMAIDVAVHYVEDLVARGRMESYPPIFFNMDADSILGPQAIERMVYRLTRRSRWSGERKMIVASNLKVSKEHFWSGWKDLFTTRGTLALCVACEYMTSISTAKHNTKILPVMVASGAFYCTWSEFPRKAGRWAAFMQSLTLKDHLRWWLGARPPRFDEMAHEPIPEAMTGEGDDAWMTWFASSAVWKNDQISLDFPRTPLHAFLRMIRFYFFRPLDYDPKAQVFTSTPTSVKGLFKQRLRWNGSRIWGMQRWHKAFSYAWGIGLTVYLNTAVLVAIHGLILVSLLAFPFLAHANNLVAVMIVLHLTYIFIRSQSLLVAFLHDEDFRDQWQKILVLPIIPYYHFVFNIVTTIISFGRDIFLFGSKVRFAPERTLIRGGTSRVALAYRAKRAFALSMRGVVHNDVPLGSFWFGWQETPWTPNGYDGWDTDRKPRVWLVPAVRTLVDSAVAEKSRVLASTRAALVHVRRRDAVVNAKGHWVLGNPPEETSRTSLAR